ncbi:EAL domain-containing protein [bacterium]|nr:EAL domain-containing protein [bacterium]
MSIFHGPPGSAIELAVLVVDPSPSERQRLVNALASLGILAVQEAQDQFEALVVTSTVPFDLVIHGVAASEGEPEFLGDVSMLTKSSSMLTSGPLSPALVEVLSPLGQDVGMPLVAPAGGSSTLDSQESRSNAGPSAAELATALRNKVLTLVFQPMVSLKDLTLAAAEASPRWNHAQFGPILPARLREIAGTSEAQVNLALYTFERALEAQQRFLKQGMPLSLHIDLGPDSFQQMGAANQLLGLFLDYPESEPQLITFDIHDSALVNPSGAFLDNLQRLHSKGFALSLAHFAALAPPGTLVQIPFSSLKLNPSQLMTTHRDRIPKIVAASQGLTAHMGIKFVVQGVHRAEEWEIVTSLGCHMAQGPVIADALAEQGFLDWIKSHEIEEQAQERPAEGFDFLLFCYILSVTQDLGVSWANSFKIIKAHNPAAQDTLNRLEHTLITGQSLSEAMRAHPEVFSARVIAMVEGGEEVSKLSKVLRRLYDRTIAQAPPLASSGLEVSPLNLAQAVEDIAEFLDLGFPLSKAVQQATTACESQPIRAGLRDLLKQLETEGEGNLGSLRYAPEVFSRYSPAFFAVGQAAGCLPTTLRDLAVLLKT